MQFFAYVRRSGDVSYICLSPSVSASLSPFGLAALTDLSPFGLDC